MYNRNGARQYQQVNATSEALEADPHRLIQLLLEAALTRLAQSKGAIDRKDMASKASLLGRVTDILQTLQLSLNHDAGGQLSSDLERLYDYMIRRLFEATSHNDTAMIDEVMGLLLNVKSGWDAIRADYLAGSPKTKPQTSPTASHVSA